MYYILAKVIESNECLHFSDVNSLCSGKNNKTREPGKSKKSTKRFLLVYRKLLILLNDCVESFYQLPLLSISWRVHSTFRHDAAHRCSQTKEVNNLIIFKL